MESKNLRRCGLVLVAVFSMLGCKSPSKPDKAPTATSAPAAVVEDCPELKPYIEKARGCTQKRQAEIMEGILSYCQNPPQGARIPKICPKDATAAINMTAGAVQIANRLIVTECEVRELEGATDGYPAKNRIDYKLIDPSTGKVVLNGGGTIFDTTQTLHESTLITGLSMKVLSDTLSYDEASGMRTVLSRSDDQSIFGKCD